MQKCKDEELVSNNNQNVLNYKGIYYEEEPEQKYFEGGAHFSFYNLCQRLEEIILTISPERRGNSIYDTPNLSNIISDSNTNTKAETRKIASDNSKELLMKEKSLVSKQKLREKATNNIPNSNSLAKNNKSGATIKSVKETFKKIQPKNLLYNSNLKTTQKQSAVKIHVNKETSPTKQYSKPNKCIIDLHINYKKTLNQTLKSQKSSSICSVTKSNNDIMYKLIKNPKPANKIINLDFNRKYHFNTNNNTNSNLNTTNYNELETSKNKDREKKKIISAFNSILNITNNKSRNLQQPNKNSLENKTAENAPNKIFVTNQLKLETNKTKEHKFEETIINKKLASRNIIPKKIVNNKSTYSKTDLTKKIYSVQNTDMKKTINTSKTKIVKLPKALDLLDSNSTINSRTTNSNKCNFSKKIENVFKDSQGGKIIKITTIKKEKSDGIRLHSNFLNFSKNLPVSKKI